MFSWLKKKSSANEKAPLEGAPTVRRQKTYQSQNGYVYQYYFAGSRRSESELGPSYEYIFPVSADRKTEILVAVAVSNAGVAAWERNHGRDLLSKERYAVAKIALFKAFDERENPDALRLPILAGEAEVKSYLEQLGRD